jgi:hypothetical protein
MNQKMMNTVLSAVVGGVVGAAVVFFAGGTSKMVDLKEMELDSLRVGTLTITKEANLLDKEGKQPELVIRDGSVLAENVVLAKKIIGRQMQGHAIVANRVFTTPDDLIATPMENWRFFAEIGSSIEAGGEIVVRNAAGPASVNRPTTNGALFRVGYDPEQRPQILALQNANRNPLEINYRLSEEQLRMLSAAMNNPQGMMRPNASGSVNPNAPPSSYDGSGAPLYQQQSVAQPDPNMTR